ncbi:uncharacterized protein N7511_007720 [Penicillium nucicola]|uniref:uncharacterized protein n=1 Tax=Penicillium nucicola TaxID=1850975 RepID=UPI0025459EF4|nr:uncharacterized protein N7511_007720 [Penicillium nucicola]KAJ5753567.1 hypothetical protein N7511_007720 [Penicillium nucicola]
MLVYLWLGGIFNLWRSNPSFSSYICGLAASNESTEISYEKLSPFYIRYVKSILGVLVSGRVLWTRLPLLMITTILVSISTLIGRNSSI